MCAGHLEGKIQQRGHGDGKHRALRGFRDSATHLDNSSLNKWWKSKAPSFPECSGQGQSPLSPQRQEGLRLQIQWHGDTGLSLEGNRMPLLWCKHHCCGLVRKIAGKTQNPGCVLGGEHTPFPSLAGLPLNSQCSEPPSSQVEASLRRSLPSHRPEERMSCGMRRLKERSCCFPWETLLLKCAGQYF